MVDIRYCRYGKYCNHVIVSGLGVGLFAALISAQLLDKEKEVGREPSKVHTTTSLLETKTSDNETPTTNYSQTTNSSSSTSSQSTFAGNITSQHWPFRHSYQTSAVLTILYAIIYIVGIVGNSFVVAIVYKSPRMRTVTNYFIANLAIADMLVLLCMPGTLMNNIFVPFYLGLFVCKTVSYLQGVSVSASINTMLAVTADRFLAICFPLDWHLSRRAARWTIVGIWLFSLSIAAPWAVFFTLTEYGDAPTPSPSTINSSSPTSTSTSTPFTVGQQQTVQVSASVLNVTAVVTSTTTTTTSSLANSSQQQQQTYSVCQESWPEVWMSDAYFVTANLFLCYLLPLCVITVCYLGIWYKIWRRSIPGDQIDGRKLELLMQKSKLKVVKMMFVVVVIFVLSWAPLYAIFIRLRLNEAQLNTWEETLIDAFLPYAQWLGASNSCINPILYTFFNSKYKRSLASFIRQAICCQCPSIQDKLIKRRFSDNLVPNTHKRNHSASNATRRDRCAIVANNYELRNNKFRIKAISARTNSLRESKRRARCGEETIGPPFVTVASGQPNIGKKLSSAYTVANATVASLTILQPMATTSTSCEQTSGVTKKLSSSASPSTSTSTTTNLSPRSLTASSSLAYAHAPIDTNKQALTTGATKGGQLDASICIDTILNERRQQESVSFKQNDDKQFEFETNTLLDIAKLEVAKSRRFSTDCALNCVSTTKFVKCPSRLQKFFFNGYSSAPAHQLKFAGQRSGSAPSALLRSNFGMSKQTNNKSLELNSTTRLQARQTNKCALIELSNVNEEEQEDEKKKSKSKFGAKIKKKINNKNGKINSNKNENKQKKNNKKKNKKKSEKTKNQLKKQQTLESTTISFESTTDNTSDLLFGSLSDSSSMATAATNTATDSGINTTKHCVKTTIKPILSTINSSNLKKFDEMQIAFCLKSRQTSKNLTTTPSDKCDDLTATTTRQRAATTSGKIDSTSSKLLRQVGDEVPINDTNTKDQLAVDDDDDEQQEQQQTGSSKQRNSLVSVVVKRLNSLGQIHFPTSSLSSSSIAGKLQK